MNIKKIAAKVSLSVTGFVLLAERVYAQAGWQPDTGYQGDLTELIRDILNTAIVMAAVVAVGFLVYNGFQYMMSAGDTAKTEEAQKGIANALIGLVICLAAAVVINFVMNRLNVDQEELTSLPTKAVVEKLV
jgi:lysylphosphatidylglycerol synthetase-like protein (DUF2156 family)